MPSYPTKQNENFFSHFQSIELHSIELNRLWIKEQSQIWNYIQLGIRTGQVYDVSEPKPKLLVKTHTLTQAQSGPGYRTHTRAQI